ncbi:MAG: DNA polymerase III subunit delta [Candidatus Nanogingivalis sp.]
MIGGKITILYGDNSYERTTQLAKMKIDAEKSGFEIQKSNSDELSKSNFVSLICGISLLSEKRFVYIRNLSENSEIWQSLAEILPRISTDVHLCLVEDKIDKRSVVYKAISKIVELYEFKNLTTRDSKNLAEFARLFAKKQGLSLDNKTASFLISWVGVDEWRIRDAIEKIALIGEANEQNIREFVPQNIESNAFVIIEMMFLGESLKLQEEFLKLRITDGEDGAFRFLGMISTQIFNLAALKIGKNIGKTTAEIAKEIGANTWALGKMENFVQNLSESQLAEIVSKFTQVDEIIKTESVDPWNLVESTILEITSKLKS